MNMDAITVVVKPTLQCNARCVYCHSLQHTPTLSLKLVETLCEQLAGFTKTNDTERVTMLWHGGEPMMMGPGYYSSVMDIQRKHLSHVELYNTMQTNACLYKGHTRKAVRRLVKTRDIGACIDPFHPTRLLPNGEDSLRQSLEALHALKSDGFQTSMIYVVHKKSLDVVRNLYYFFKNLDVPDVLFHPVEECPDPEYALTAREWGEFLVRLWDVWEEDGFRFAIYPLAAWRNSILFDEPVEMCEYGQKDRSGLFLTIAPDGNAYPCPRFQDKDSHCLGNIGQEDLGAIASHKWAYLIQDLKEQLSEDCISCSFLELCRSGCVATRNGSGKTMWCRGLKRVFGHIMSKPYMRLTV